MTKKKYPTSVQTVIRDGDTPLKHWRSNPKGDGRTLEKRLTPRILKDLETRKRSNKEVAEELGVSETYLSRMVAARQAKEPGMTPLLREAASKIYKARKQTREMLAKKVNKGHITLELAAKEAGCSVRTMYRYCAKFAKPTKE